MPKKGRSLAEINPELAREWHPTKNGELTPYDFTYGSGKKVWWKCDKGDDHEWLMSMNDRTSKRKRGCPFCSGKKVSISNCIATTHPEIAKQWHPYKNGNLTPQKITSGSHKKIWWKCDKENDHEWEAPPYNRLKANCPICAGQKTVKSNTLSYKYPEIAKKWHPTKNGNLKPSEIFYSSGKKVWWNCDKGDDHEFKSTVRNSVKQGINYCPFCSGKKVSKFSSLQFLFPDIASQWHPTKNGNLSPQEVMPKSNRKVWWQCNKGIDHIWKTSIAHRQNRGCPFCSNQKASITNSLETTYPEIAKEWHHELNIGITPKDVLPGTEKKVWWICAKNNQHIWKAYIHIRVRGTNCPFCTLTPQSRQELLINFELQQFFKINPKGFKKRINGSLHSIDIYIAQLNLAIEFDGSYWHKGNREFDKMKSEEIISSGFDLLRIREEPLKPINEFDIVSKRPFNAKTISDNILKFILTRYNLYENQENDIKDYLRKRKLQNEKKLDKYIDQILEEKANLKKLR